MKDVHDSFKAIEVLVVLVARPCVVQRLGRRYRTIRVGEINSTHETDLVSIIDIGGKFVDFCDISLRAFKLCYLLALGCLQLDGSHAGAQLIKSGLAITNFTVTHVELIPSNEFKLYRCIMLVIAKFGIGYLDRLKDMVWVVNKPF